jgi:dCTP deaminase
MLLSNRDISEEERHGAIVIQPFRPELLQPSSIDVLLSSEFMVQRRYSDPEIVVDPRIDNSGMFDLVEIPEGGEFIIYPGDFVLGSTYETILLGANFAARIEGKSSLGRLGLVVHSTAGFIDPGFDGQITLELSNVGTTPIVLIPGMKVAQLCFFKLPEPTTILYGTRFAGSHYQNQSGPTCSRSHQNFKVYDVYGSLDTSKDVR